MKPNNTCIFNTEKCYPPFHCVITSLRVTFNTFLLKMFKNSKHKVERFPFHIRKLQKSTRSLNVGIPFNFAELLKWAKGDLVKITIDSSMDFGNRLVIEKLRFREQELEQEDYDLSGRQIREGEA